MHEKIYTDEVAIKAMEITKKAFITYYNNDLTIYSKYFPVLNQMYTQESELYFSGQEKFDEFINNLQQNSQTEIGKIK